MRKVLIGAVTCLLAVTLTQSAFANADLAKAKGCTVCHTPDKKIVGPSYKEVAAKYKADKGAEATLATKVKAGGKGTWGEAAMPPNPTLSDDELKTLVKWVLSVN